MAALIAVYGVLGAITWTRDEVFKHSPAETIWHVRDVLNYLPPLSNPVWVIALLAIFLVVSLEGSYRLAQKTKLQLEELSGRPNVTLDIGTVDGAADFLVTSEGASAVDVTIEDLNIPFPESMMQRSEQSASTMVEPAELPNARFERSWVVRFDRLSVVQQWSKVLTYRIPEMIGPYNRNIRSVLDQLGGNPEVELPLALVFSNH